jgi:hypothetical protein
VRLTATLLTFGEDSSPDWFGDVVTFAPGSLYTDDHQSVPLMVQHDTGREAAGVALAVYTDGDAVMGDFELLDTPTGRAAATELGASVRWDVSVGVIIDEYDLEDLEDDAEPSWWGPSQRLTARSADLVEVSLCLRGRMPSARVESITDEGISP